MKKLIALVLACLLVDSLFAACGEKKTEDTSLQAVLDKGELVIGTSPDFPPFENLNDDGSITGIEIDILSKICEKLGVTLKIEPMDFDAVLPGVQTGKFDLAVSGITATEERKQNALFTDPYCLANIAIVVKEGSDIAGKADLADKTVSLQTGTTAELYCNANNYANNAFQANADAQMALTTGKVDAWIIDDLTAKDMVDAYNAEHDDKLVILDEAMTTEPYGFATKQGNETLINEINAILADLLADGTIKDLFAQYEADFVDPATAA